MSSSNGTTQLVRMLRIVEYFQAGDHTLAEAAAEFGIRPAKLRELLDDWGTISHSRGDSLDSVTIDLPERNDEVVIIERDQGAARVLQPTRQEAALALAACLNAAETAPSELAPRLRELAKKLSAQIALPEDTVQLRIPHLLPQINQTIENRHWAALRYQPVGRSAKDYCVDPVRIRTQGKLQYLDCWAENAGWRVFRLDRVLHWRELEKAHVDHGTPPSFQANLWAEFTIADSARWILDDFPWAETTTVRVRGQLRIHVTTAISSSEWWTQMWLRYGDLFSAVSYRGEGELIAQLQASLRATTLQLKEIYADPE